MKIIIISKTPNSLCIDARSAFEIRNSQLLPALERNEPVCIDFSNVVVATQAWVNSLLMPALLEQGIDRIKLIEFKGCNNMIKEMVTFSTNKAIRRSKQIPKPPSRLLH